MLFTRKTPDAAQKKLAFKVSDSIAEVLRDHLIWTRYCKYNLFIGLIYLLLFFFFFST
jgi:hypothetical protein